jgi:hypothetical protein
MKLHRVNFYHPRSFGSKSWILLTGFNVWRMYSIDFDAFVFGWKIAVLGFQFQMEWILGT